MEIVSLHDYNTARQAYGMDPIQLKDHEAYLYSNYEMVMDGVKEIISKHPEILYLIKKLKSSMMTLNVYPYLQPLIMVPWNI